MVIASPSPRPRHQQIVQEIFRQIDRAEPVTGPIEVFLDTDVRFSGSVVYQPDVSVYLASRLPETLEELDIVPDLVFEVLSPGSKAIDLITKLTDYERFGVREYVVADGTTGEARCWARAREVAGSGGFVESPPMGLRWESRAIPGLGLSLAGLRAAAGVRSGKRIQ